MGLDMVSLTHQAMLLAKRSTTKIFSLSCYFLSKILLTTSVEGHCIYYVYFLHFNTTLIVICFKQTEIDGYHPNGIVFRIPININI